MMAGRCLQKMVYSIDIFLVMMVVMVHDSLGGFGGSARLPHCLEQGAPELETLDSKVLVNILDLKLWILKLRSWSRI